MLIGTRFADTNQVHLVKMPGGAREQLTFLPDRVLSAEFEPVTGASFVFSKDIGGGEWYQLYRYDVATGDITLLTDGKSRNSARSIRPQSFSRSKPSSSPSMPAYGASIAPPSTLRTSFKHAGPDKVSEFIASVGLRNTMIPESTRSLFGYLLNAKDYKTFTWEELGAAANLPSVDSPLNKGETMASTADDFVSCYSRALHGDFFQHKETLNEFRRILSLGDAIWLLPLPLGASAFTKGGSIDVPGFHAICAPGAMLFDNRWVYFCLTINWYTKAETDPATGTAFAAAGSKALTPVKQTLSC
jgi:hypothetical protein